MKGKTRDEQYLITLHQLASSKGNTFAEIDKYHVGQTLGQNNKSVDNIVRMLLQTNFIRRGDDNAIFLTENGVELIEELSAPKKSRDAELFPNRERCKNPRKFRMLI